MTWATAGWLILIVATLIGVAWTERDIARRRTRRANRRWRG